VKRGALPGTRPGPKSLVVDEQKLLAKVLERDVETAVDRLMVTALGFRAIRFSQSRATQQTPGIPDRRYHHRALGITVWVETKRPKGGKMSDAQREFMLDVLAAGEQYVLAHTLEPMEEWAIRGGLASRGAHGELQGVRR
jgi:hypothetical protein